MNIYLPRICLLVANTNTTPVYKDQKWIFLNFFFSLLTTNKFDEIFLSFLQSKTVFANNFLSNFVDLWKVLWQNDNSIRPFSWFWGLKSGTKGHKCLFLVYILFIFYTYKLSMSFKSRFAKIYQKKIPFFFVVDKSHV